MRLPDLKILNGQTNGVSIDVAEIDELTIYGPAALTGVISTEVSPDGGTTWYPYAGAPAINVRVTYSTIHAHKMRLVSTLAEGAERVFPVHGSSLVTT
ncbi:hypothetical protein LCGC14_0251510 [marine sediment metagenome]|uniref:Uncharacterized protein n=1 Tax=marine sediment metagenome TaxID=412755 RepID=A0A0F9U8Z4_9ZZZZ